MNEIWKDVVNFNGFYQVSNFGNIKSFKRYEEGKLLKPKFDKDGYKEIGIKDVDGKRVFKRVHRLVAEAFIPNPNNCKFINHKDNNPNNNNVNNIEWCSIEYNNKYRFTNGNASHKGIRHPQATITEDVAKEIYILGYSGKYTESELAAKFNTTRSVVNKIRLKMRWTHITDDIDLKGASGFQLTFKQFKQFINE